ncbi:copper amine oxidase [Crepidotus variabilis]|uniref:Amine oxidase n=1 Tax=Crepidotus variabilis TaxID=179855 RepID=A0A9P6EUX0_9AGAR|nr:copper amine oxidase [Crepidotus variabilis]
MLSPKPQCHSGVPFNGFSWGRLCLWLSFGLNIALILLILLQNQFSSLKGRSITGSSLWLQSCAQVPIQDEPVAHRCSAPRVPHDPQSTLINPWSSLDVSEIATVENWLDAPERQLNLTKAAHAVISDNVIYMIEKRLWVTWRRNTAGSFLLPFNFYQYVDISGTDTSQWKVLKTLYHDQLFSTVESFLEAFDNGTLIRHPEQANPKLNHSWTQRTRKGPDRDLEHLPGPRSVSFAGARYRVDRKTQHISWMGWKMYLGFDRDMGLNLWDINFRGERIIYQLAPQEALAQYGKFLAPQVHDVNDVYDPRTAGGNDPVQATTAWLDRHFGMGSLVRDMIPHYDCPQDATYLPATTYTVIGNIHVQRAICIFEQDTGKPLSRHLGYEPGETGAIKSYVLTVRTMITYVLYYLSHIEVPDGWGKFDYLFYLAGSIEVRLSASGYMQGGYWNEKQEGYGTRIRDTSMGNVHDHVVNYKVDFDIAGRKNSLLKTTTSQQEVLHPWHGDDWGQTVIQQKISKEFITKENDALLKYPANFQGGYAIVNRDAKNKWGNLRGYAIHPGYSPIHNTVVGSKRLLNNANWARYNLAISKRKETEPSSSSMWNLHLPGDPMVDFHDFFDGENITQQDLLAWINLGMHHLPVAEDSPMTKTNLATSSFVLSPINYFDYDISMDLKNAILLQEPRIRGDAFDFDNYGVQQDFTCLPDPPSPFEYREASLVLSDGSFIAVNKSQLRAFSEMFLRVKAGD